MLLYPALTRADALKALAEAQFVVMLLPFALGGLVLLVVGVRFSITDFQTGQPRRRTAVVGVLCLLLGLLMALASHDLYEHGTLFPNLWTDLYVPLAWGLWAAGRARRAPDAGARVQALALVLAAALAGVGSVLGLCFPEIVPLSYRPYDQHSAGLLVGLAALAGTWALVLYQYRGALAAASQPVAKLGWLLGVAPVLGAGYVLLLRVVVDGRRSWPEAALTLLLYVGSGLGMYWLQWAFYPGNAADDNGSELPVEQQSIE